MNRLGASRAPALPELLADGMDALAGTQLPSGEMPSYRRDVGGRRYRRSILVSTRVHDALGCFDPYSPWGESQATDQLRPAVLPRFLSQVASVRRRIRGFVAWHEEAHGGWRASGRGCGRPLDAAATACAAAVLLEGVHRTRHQPWRRHLRVLAQFRISAPNGGDATPWYRSRLPALGAPKASGEASGKAVDLVANAHVARLLALTGEEVAPILEALGRAIEGDGRAPALELYHAVARVFRHGLLPGRGAMAEILVPRILERLGKDDEDLLSSAMTLTALLDLGFNGPELASAGRALHRRLARSAAGGQGRPGAGTPALTLALAVSGLARWGVATGGHAS